jgi:hypothetical protein
MTTTQLLSTVASVAFEPDASTDDRRARLLGDDDLLTQIEAARERRCSVRKLERERAEGRGPPYVQDGGRVFYRWGDVRKFIAAHVHGGDLRVAATSPRPGRPRKRALGDVGSTT